MSSHPNVRNALIVLAVAAVVALAPGGGTTAWVASLLYREHRTTLYSLGDRHRTALYVAAGVLAVTLTATPQLWGSSAGSVAWLVLVGTAVYVACTVFWAARKY
jgi:hypothetical protein